MANIDFLMATTAEPPQKFFRHLFMFSGHLSIRTMSYWIKPTVHLVQYPPSHTGQHQMLQKKMQNLYKGQLCTNIVILLAVVFPTYKFLVTQRETLMFNLITASEIPFFILVPFFLSSLKLRVCQCDVSYLPTKSKPLATAFPVKSDCMLSDHLY